MIINIKKVSALLKKQCLYKIFTIFALGILMGWFSSLTVKAYSNSQISQEKPETKISDEQSDQATSEPAVTKPQEKPVVSDPKPAPVSKPVPKPAPVAVKPKPAPVPSPAPKSQPQPTPAPKPQPAPVSNSILDLINDARKANGLAPVKYNSLLNQAASNKSKDMANKNYFSHTSPEGKSDFLFMSEVGYQYHAAGSNIAKGNFGSDKGVFDAWMASPGHRANILASYGQEIGFSQYNGYYTLFVAQPR